MDEISRLIKQLKSPDKTKRYDALEKLRMSPSLGPDAIAALQTATSDTDGLLAEKARIALERHLPSKKAADWGTQPPAPEGIPPSNRTPKSTAVLALVFGVLVWLCFGAMMVAVGAAEPGKHLKAEIAGAAGLLWAILGIAGTTFGILAIRRKGPKHRLAVVGLVLNLLCIVPVVLLLLAAYVTGNFSTWIPGTSNLSSSIYSSEPTRTPEPRGVRLLRAALTADDISHFLPVGWEESPRTAADTIAEQLCELECLARGWISLNSNMIVDIDIVRLGSAAEAEAEIRAAMTKASGLSFRPEYEAGIGHLPTHTWSAVSDSEPHTTTLLRLTQDQDYYIRTWIHYFDGLKSEKEKSLAKQNLFLIAEMQWGKLYDVGYVRDLSSAPLSSSVSQAEPTASPVAVTTGSLSAAILTWNDLNSITTNTWGDTGSTGSIQTDLCKIDCVSKEWYSDDGLAQIELARLHDPQTAENEIQLGMSSAKALEYHPQTTPRAAFLPDHTWLGLHENDITTFLLLTQDQDIFMTTWLFLDSTNLSNPEISSKTKTIFMIAGKQWKKLLDLGYLHNVTFSPLSNYQLAP